MALEQAAKEVEWAGTNNMEGGVLGPRVTLPGLTQILPLSRATVQLFQVNTTHKEMSRLEWQLIRPQ